MAEYIIKVSDTVYMDGHQNIIEKRDLVRCKDCKFIDESVKTRFFCGRLARCVDADWFCADGERDTPNVEETGTFFQEKA